MDVKSETPKPVTSGAEELLGIPRGRRGRYTKEALCKELQNMTHGIAYVTGRLRAKPLDQPFQDNLLHALVHYHPDASAKIGTGIHHFEMRMRQPYGTRRYTFCARTAHGMTCPTQNVLRRFDRVMLGMHCIERTFPNAVYDPDLRPHLMEQDPTCAECGVAGVDLQVDHDGVPFAKILDDFLCLQGLDLRAD